MDGRNAPKSCSGKVGEAESTIEIFLKAENNEGVAKALSYYVQNLAGQELFKFKDALNQCNADKRAKDHTLPEFHVY